MAYVKVKDGTIKEVELNGYIATQVLTPQGFERLLEGRVLTLGDFKPSFLKGKEDKGG